MLTIFNCDGTLVDSLPITNRIIANVLKENGVKLGFKDVSNKYTGTCINTIIQQNQAAASLKHVQDESESRILVALSRELNKLSGVQECVQTVQDKCVVSNHNQQHIIQCLGVAGLQPYFEQDYIFSRDDVSYGIPQPDIYLHAAAEMGYAPHNCIVIDGTPQGIQAAREAGMIAIGFTGASHVQEGYSELMAASGAKYVCSDYETLSKTLRNVRH